MTTPAPSPIPWLPCWTFYESAYQAGARLAGWNIGRLASPGGITDPHPRRYQDLSWEQQRR
jgi:hypothetical protein